jgi:hypothetical protein
MLDVLIYYYLKPSCMVLTSFHLKIELQVTYVELLCSTSTGTCECIYFIVFKRGFTLRALSPLPWPYSHAIPELPPKFLGETLIDC